MVNPSTEFDTPWKDILEQYFQDFISFFFPQAHNQIDWTRTPEFLDKELQQVVRDAELGKRLADKLVKVYLRDGQEVWVLLHVEVQSQSETDFAGRMFTYNYRIYDRYKRSVASLAVLGDERKNWRPSSFGYNLFGSKVEFSFPVVKLLDYSQQWAALESSSNPFATVVMAHLKALETSENRAKRKEWKLALIKRLYQLQFQRKDVINLFFFIDWMMTLPFELEKEFWQELNQYQEERRMPYISSVERIGIEKGRKEGKEEGREEGRQEGLLKGIELGLKLKFGASGLSLLPEISQLEDVVLLEAILESLETANTLDELRQIWQQTTSE